MTNLGSTEAAGWLPVPGQVSQVIETPECGSGVQVGARGLANGLQGSGRFVSVSHLRRQATFSLWLPLCLLPPWFFSPVSEQPSRGEGVRHRSSSEFSFERHIEFFT